MGHKLVSEPPRKVIQRLRRHKFILSRQVGGHAQYWRRVGEKDYLVTVPMHPRDLTKRELQSIINQSGLTRDEFYGD